MTKIGSSGEWMFTADALYNSKQIKKDKKKHNWSNKGGHIAPIFVPPTPDGELAKMLREIAENEAEAEINF